MAAQTPKQIASGQRRSLQAMREKLLNMAVAWDGIDEYNISVLTEAADKLLDVHANLIEQTEENA
ncbi:MAG: hypothetical protein ACK4KV_19175 [Rhodocyclaceae bacterium]